MTEKIPTQIPHKFARDIKEIAEIEGRRQSDVFHEVLAKGIQEKKIELAVKLYIDKKVSLWKAAKIAGVSLWAMIDLLKKRNVEVNYSKEDLEKDILAVEAK